MVNPCHDDDTSKLGGIASAIDEAEVGVRDLNLSDTRDADRVIYNAIDSADETYSKKAMARGVSADELLSLLENRQCERDLDKGEDREESRKDRPLLIIDVRKLSAYLGPSRRIKGSLNIGFPSLLIKRFRKGNTSNFQLLSSFITTETGKAIYEDVLRQACPNLKDAQGFNRNSESSLRGVDIVVVDERPPRIRSSALVANKAKPNKKISGSLPPISTHGLADTQSIDSSSSQSSSPASPSSFLSHSSSSLSSTLSKGDGDPLDSMSHNAAKSNIAANQHSASLPVLRKVVLPIHGTDEGPAEILLKYLESKRKTDLGITRESDYETDDRKVNTSLHEERSMNSGLLMYLEQTWDQLTETQGFDKWLARGEVEAGFHNDHQSGQAAEETLNTQASSNDALGLVLERSFRSPTITKLPSTLSFENQGNTSDTGLQSLKSSPGYPRSMPSEEVHGVALSGLRTPSGDGPGSGLLASSSTTSPSPSPGTPHPPRLKRIDTSDNLLGVGARGSGAGVSGAGINSMNSPTTTNVADSAGRQGDRVNKNAPSSTIGMSIQSLCHVQAKVPSSSIKNTTFAESNLAPSTDLRSNSRSESLNQRASERVKKRKSATFPVAISTSSSYISERGTAELSRSSSYSPISDNLSAASAFIVSTMIPNFLYLGPEPTTKQDLDELERIGVKEILNVAKECGKSEYTANGAVEDKSINAGDTVGWSRFEKYWKIPMTDSVEEVGVQQSMAEACTILGNAQLHSKPVYCHCRAGKSRSVTIVLAYLVHRNHWTLKRAYTHVSERREGISPNIGFVAELMTWEEKERGVYKSSGVFGNPNEASSRSSQPLAGPHRHLQSGGEPRDGSLSAGFTGDSVYSSSPTQTDSVLLPDGRNGEMADRSSYYSEGLSNDIDQSSDSYGGKETELEVRSNTDGTWVKGRKGFVRNEHSVLVRRATQAGLESVPLGHGNLGKETAGLEVQGF